MRDVVAYNDRFQQRRLNPEKGHRYMPYIVMIVDEFADLITTAGKDISLPIARIAQKGRAAGMHMIIATQRPSTDIITGMIKANFPARNSIPRAVEHRLKDYSRPARRTPPHRTWRHAHSHKRRHRTCAVRLRGHR